MIEDQYHLLSLNECSGLQVGQEGPLVSLYQITIGVEETSIWTEENEAAYRVYADAENWKIIRSVIRTPSFWDMGIIDPDNIVNLDFDLSDYDSGIS